MQTVSTIVQGISRANALVLKLMSMSQWVEFEPYPDDQYRITVKVEIAHVLEGIYSVEVVEQLATYDDVKGVHLEDVPLLDAHIVATETEVVVDMAQPAVPWNKGPRVFIERHADHWRCIVHPDADDAKAMVQINDDGTLAVEEY